MGKILKILSKTETSKYIMNNRVLTNSEWRKEIENAFIVYEITRGSLKMFYDPTVISPYDLQLGLIKNLMLVSCNNYDFLVESENFIGYKEINVIHTDLESNEIYIKLL